MVLDGFLYIQASLLPLNVQTICRRLYTPIAGSRAVCLSSYQEICDIVCIVWTLQVNGHSPGRGQTEFCQIMLLLQELYKYNLLC
jgi:hypothetical protein